MHTKGSHIGTLIKSHGYKGALVLSGEAELILELTEGIPLFIEISGQRVPFFIEEVSPDASGKRCVIKFEFIDSEFEARRYISCEVYSDQHAVISESDSELQRLIGYTVVDKNSGTHFIVRDIFNNPQNPLLILGPAPSDITTPTSASGNQEIMLPAKADYILKVNHKRKKISVDFPEGLAD